ncbi:YqaJ viral recombinase family protein [Cereibacter sphaeroides]|uniref:YqaJ viral recombinase family protein n=1 Tax=Cereibacter sphaeroides TaxID=1063 RepID=UPI001F34B081|nr:YqaJ viral recombinase family protein [Cereibacter sphaeroides]MCE6959669.1 YqaJ viral recombinase family protein [Cereibacter sphaeroides]MCE6974470.1 YqaJ viral recombinase family protein [Cereibacter sphaeroides]
MNTKPDATAADAAEEARQALLEACQAFDVAAEAEAAAAPPADTAESVRRLKALIDLLPQRAAIEEKHITRWLDRTTLMAGQRMTIEKGEITVPDVHAHVLWHVRRASGIGGSEASTVLKHYRGERGTFGDAHNLVKEKLLIMSPQPSTPEMARGVRAEPWLQKMYLAKTGATVDKEGLKRLKGFRWDRRPVSIGTPDDLVIFPDDLRKIIDYKAPSADVVSDYEKNGISFDYVCQVHHYSILAMAARVAFKEMELQVFDPRTFEMLTFPVAFDKALAQELVHACHKLWMEHVMTGVAPEAPKTDVLDVEDDAVIALGVQAAMLKAIEDDVKKRKEDALSRISLLGAEWHQVAVGKLELACASFNRTRKWDEDKLCAIATAAGVDREAFMKVGKDLDEDKVKAFVTRLYTEIHEGRDVRQMLEAFHEEGLPIEKKLDLAALAQHLEELDISTNEAAGVSERFALTAKKKGPEFERLVLLKDHVSEMMEEIEERVIATAPAVVQGAEDEAEPDEDELPEMPEML